MALLSFFTPLRVDSLKVALRWQNYILYPCAEVVSVAILLQASHQLDFSDDLDTTVVVIGEVFD